MGHSRKTPLAVVFMTLGEPQAHGDTAEAVPFVRRCLPYSYLASNTKLSFNSTLFSAASGSTTRYIFASACLPSNVITT